VPISLIEKMVQRGDEQTATYINHKLISRKDQR
jgi:hypothetical protein